MALPKHHLVTYNQSTTVDGGPLSRLTDETESLTVLI